MKGLRYMICFALTALMAAACYDDSEVWDKFEEIDSEMSEMASRIDSLEQKMADNVDAIQSMISVGSIASWNYNAETGKGTITLVDGKVITINQNISGYSVITVEKDADGTYYWAISRDGMNIPLLDADNKKVPVSVTPALKISKDNEWMISVDGGKTWVKTGISYYAEKEDEIVTEVVVFEKAETDGDYLILTLAGGTEIKVAIVGEAVFKAAAETLWFSRCVQEKSVALEMKNVKAFTVTEKPEGWRARSDEGYIYVTSPDNFESFPEEGKVKVFALFSNGATPEIVEINVAYEPYVTLTSIDAKVTLTMGEHTSEDFTGYLMKGWKENDYTPEKALEWLEMNGATQVPYSGSATYELDELIEDFDESQQYILFAAPFLPPLMLEQGKIQYELSDIYAIQCRETKSYWNLSDISFDSAMLSASMSVLEYYGGFMRADMWDNVGKSSLLENLNVGSMIPSTVVDYSGPANGFPDGQEDVMIVPATEYVIWYVPHNAEGSYTDFDIVEYRFTSLDVSPAVPSISAPSFEIQDVLSSGFTAKVIPVGSSYRTYAAILKSVAIPSSDADIVRYLVNVNDYSEGSAVNEITRHSFSPEDEVYLLAVSLTASGGFGEILKEKVPLKELVMTSAMGVNVTGIEHGLGDVELTVEYVGNPAYITYMAASNTYFQDDDLEKLLALRQMGDAVTVAVSEAGNKLKLTRLQIGTEYTFYAVVADSKGDCSYLCKYQFVPEIGIQYRMKSHEKYEYGMPKLSGVKSGTSYTLRVDMPKECIRYWLFCGDPEYIGTDEYAAADKLFSMALESLKETVHETSLTNKVYEDIKLYDRIFMVWLDDEGYGHGVYEFNPNK